MWYPIGLLYLIFGLVALRTYFKVKIEMNSSPSEPKLTDFQLRRLQKLKLKTGLSTSSAKSIDELLAYLKISPAYKGEYETIKKIHLEVKTRAKKADYKLKKISIITGLVHALLALKSELYFKKFPETPSIEAIVDAFNKKIPPAKIVKLYSKGLTIENIIESNDISEAHAIALYS